jgi:hypothetical protein
MKTTEKQKGRKKNRGEQREKREGEIKKKK